MARRKRSKGSADSRPTIDVGARLKAQRTKLGLTQRDLAGKAGVTNGMISMIEQNKHSPSRTTRRASAVAK